MTLHPMLMAPLAVQLHALAALAAFVLGIVQFLAPKGTVPHRLLGRVWVAIMAGVALSSFVITEVAGPGRFSWIHGLSVLTLVMLPVGVWAARAGWIGTHQRVMQGLYVGGLLVAGAFTFVPPRVIGRMVFGG